MKLLKRFFLRDQTSEPVSIYWTQSLVSAGCFKLGWAAATQRGMDALTIIENLDVDKHLLNGLSFGAESLLPQQLHFQRREKRFVDGVVPHIAFAAVALNTLAVAQALAKAVGCVL